MYGDELKLTRNDFIQLHKDYYGTFEEPDHEGNDKRRKTRGASFLEYVEVHRGMQAKTYDEWRLEDGITPLFLEFICLFQKIFLSG